MNILIIGCGRVGSRLALQLSCEGNKVSVVDRNPLAFDKLQGCFDGNMIVGTGIDEDVKCDIIAMAQDNQKLRIFSNMAMNINQRAKCNVWIFNNKML